jgi:hypothetical protein
VVWSNYFVKRIKKGGIMKRTGIFTICILIASIFNSCKKEDSPIKAVDNGYWKIGYFSKNGDDRTQKFSGYRFCFDKKGKVVANCSSGTWNGGWSYCNSNCTEMALDFGNAPLNELNEHWEIFDQNDQVMHLRNISGERKDYLDFRKL